MPDPVFAVLGVNPEVEVALDEVGRVLLVDLTGQRDNCGAGLSTTGQFEVVIEVVSIMSLAGIDLKGLISVCRGGEG
jgi:hypothetical protein